MKLVFRTLALARYLTLRKQLKDLEKAIGTLSVDQKRALFALSQKEFANAAAAAVPHLYSSENPERYSPWGNGTTIAWNASSQTICRLNCAASRCGWQSPITRLKTCPTARCRICIAQCNALFACYVNQWETRKPLKAPGRGTKSPDQYFDGAPRRRVAIGRLTSLEMALGRDPFAALTIGAPSTVPIFYQHCVSTGRGLFLSFTNITSLWDGDCFDARYFYRHFVGCGSK